MKQKKKKKKKKKKKRKEVGGSVLPHFVSVCSLNFVRPNDCICSFFFVWYTIYIINIMKINFQREKQHIKIVVLMILCNQPARPRSKKKKKKKKTYKTPITKMYAEPGRK